MGVFVQLGACHNLVPGYFGSDEVDTYRLKETCYRVSNISGGEDVTPFGASQARFDAYMFIASNS